MTSLSTHVLDTELGRPAVGVRVSLVRGDALIASTETGTDGRIANLADASLDEGSYRLVFEVAEYLARQGRPAPFLERVIIEFHLDSTQPHYHVPLLVTRFACTSYRGT
jgi:5-hydroxyisourate hydrolase